VGAAIASVSQDEKGICALLENMLTVISVTHLVLEFKYSIDKNIHEEEFIKIIMATIKVISPTRFIIIVYILLITDFLFW